MLINARTSTAFRLYVDKDLAQGPEFTFLAGMHEERVTISMTAFDRLVRPVHAALAALP